MPIQLKPVRCSSRECNYTGCGWLRGNKLLTDMADQPAVAKQDAKTPFVNYVEKTN